jgi:vacuolar-type H+-ATPase subunit H
MMVKKSRNTQEVLVGKFKKVKNGLDEGEVFSYINQLMEQNRSLAGKLEHLDALTRLAERVVVEADKVSEHIKNEIVENANAKAAVIITEAHKRARTEANTIIAEAQRRAEQKTRELVAAAEEQAQSMLKYAAAMAEKVQSDANEQSNSAIADAEQKASSIEQQAEDTLKSAQEKAKAIKADVYKKAARILFEAKQEKDEAHQKGIDAAAEEGQVILQSAIDKAEITKVKAEVEAKKIMDEAKKKAEDLRKKSGRLAENEIQHILKEQKAGAAQVTLPSKEEDERKEYHPRMRRGKKGTMRYCWDVEIERQQHEIEIISNMALGLFATGAGRLLVDGETILHWGCNPFSVIPAGRLHFKVANKRAYISPEGTTAQYPILVLGNEEKPRILIES